MKDKKNKNENFIKISNSMLTEGHNDHLNMQELYLYSFLYENMSIKHSIIITISIIGDYLNIPFANDKKRNLAKIKEALLSLKDKELIKFDNPNPKNNDAIKINFNLVDADDGFVKISFEKFNNFDSLIDYYIYVAVAKWQNGARYSYNRWAKLLKCTRKTAIEKVNAAIERGIIYKNIGDYAEINTQDTNLYSISPFKKEEKTIMTMKEETKKVAEQLQEEIKIQYDALKGITNMSDEEMEISKHLKVFETYSYEGKTIFPQVDNYLFYLRLKHKAESNPVSKLEKELLITASNRMKEMQNNPQFKADYKETQRKFEQLKE